MVIGFFSRGREKLKKNEGAKEEYTHTHTHTHTHSGIQSGNRNVLEFIGPTLSNANNP